MKNFTRTLLHIRTVKDISHILFLQTKNITTCGPDSTVLDVVKTMKNRHLRRLPVVNDENILVGLVTDFDLALFGWELE